MEVKKRNSKFVVDNELGSIKDVKSIKQVAEDKEAYEDILKNAVVTRVANKGDKFITETITYNVLEIEADPEFPIYKYIFEGKEYFSNFQFANYVEIINPQTIN
jgi:hypothetical protein